MLQQQQQQQYPQYLVDQGHGGGSSGLGNIKSERRKTVTFLGEVETIRCDDDRGGAGSTGSAGGGGILNDSSVSSSSTSGVPGSVALSPMASDGEDYVESRV